MAVFSTALNCGSIVRGLLGGSSDPMDLEWNLLPRAVAVPPRYRSLHARRLPRRRGVRRLPAPSTDPLQVWHWSRPRRTHCVARPWRPEPARVVTMAEQSGSPSRVRGGRVAGVGWGGGGGGGGGPRGGGGGGWGGGPGRCGRRGWYRRNILRPGRRGSEGALRRGKSGDEVSADGRDVDVRSFVA